MLATTYAGWLLLTWHYSDLPWWLVVPAGGWLLAWHGSLQHEALHGHPTRHEALNGWLVTLPLALWLPYPVYRDSHRLHHRTDALTDPFSDPESYYVDATRWQSLGQIRRAVLTLNNTLAGRLAVGPWLAVATLWWAEARRVAGGDLGRADLWTRHLMLCTLILVWTTVICGIPVWAYVLGFVWPGLSLTLLRSFAEHRPGADQDRRTAIVEAGPLLSLLYLNNNLHLVHHDSPELPWYALRRVYRARREELLRRNGTYVFSGGYAEIVRRYLFRLRDHPAHPGRHDHAGPQMVATAPL